MFKLNIRYAYIYLLILTCCLQNINLIQLNGFAFKLYHLFSLLGLLFLLKREKVFLPEKRILLFFLIISLISTFAYLKFGFDSLILNYLFGLYIIVLIINISSDIESSVLLSIFQYVALTIAFFTIIRFCFNINTIVQFLSSPSINGHIGGEIGFLFGGGSNLEATWIALMGFLFLRDKRQVPYFIFSIITSVIYTSRAGIICNLMLFIFILSQFFNKKNIINCLILILLFTVLLFVMYKIGFLNYIIKRFILLNTLDDKGIIGRTTIWTYVFRAFLTNPFGYGLR